MSDEVDPARGGGDPACWLGAVCVDCGRIPDPPATLDPEGRCPRCRRRPEEGRVSS